MSIFPPVFHVDNDQECKPKQTQKEVSSTDAAEFVECQQTSMSKEDDHIGKIKKTAEPDEIGEEPVSPKDAISQGSNEIEEYDFSVEVVTTTTEPNEIISSTIRGVKSIVKILRRPRRPRYKLTLMKIMVHWGL